MREATGGMQPNPVPHPAWQPRSGHLWLNGKRPWCPSNMHEVPSRIPLKEEWSRGAGGLPHCVGGVVFGNNLIEKVRRIRQ